MTVWPLAAGVLLVGGLVPAMIIAYRDTAARRLVGLELASATGTLVMLVCARRSTSPAT